MHVDWILLPVLLATMAALLFVLRRTRFGRSSPGAYCRASAPAGCFIASVSFFLTFAIVRGMVFLYRASYFRPFHYVIMEGRHGPITWSFGIFISVVCRLRAGLCEVGNGTDLVVYSGQQSDVIAIWIGCGADSR